MKIATVKTDERILRPWTEIARRHGEVVVIDGDCVKSINELFQRLLELDDDVVYCHSVMALHDLCEFIMPLRLRELDCVSVRHKGDPNVALNLIAFTHKGLETLVEYASKGFTYDDKISQESNCNNLIMQAFGQRCRIIYDDNNDKVVESADSRSRGTIATYVGGRETMQMVQGAGLDVYDVMGVMLENLTTERKEVRYA